MRCPPDLYSWSVSGKMFLDMESILQGSLPCRLPSEHRNAEAGLPEQSSAPTELSHQHSVLRAAQSPRQGHSRGHLEHPQEHSKGSHSPALLCVPAELRAGTASWEPSSGIWDISAHGQYLVLCHKPAEYEPGWDQSPPVLLVLRPQGPCAQHQSF